MITVTQEAKRRFLHVREEAEFPEGMALRLDTTGVNRKGGGSGVAMYIDAPRRGDQRIEDWGEELLYVSGIVCAAYDGCILDLIKTPEGTGLSLGPPEAGRDARS